jgi:hypothetical protein
MSGTFRATSKFEYLDHSLCSPKDQPFNIKFKHN